MLWTGTALLEVNLLTAIAMKGLRAFALAVLSVWDAYAYWSEWLAQSLSISALDLNVTFSERWCLTVPCKLATLVTHRLFTPLCFLHSPEQPLTPLRVRVWVCVPIPPPMSFPRRQGLWAVSCSRPSSESSVCLAQSGWWVRNCWVIQFQGSDSTFCLGKRCAEPGR